MKSSDVDGFSARVMYFCTKTVRIKAKGENTAGRKPGRLANSTRARPSIARVITATQAPVSVPTIAGTKSSQMTTPTKLRDDFVVIFLLPRHLRERVR